MLGFNFIINQAVILKQLLECVLPIDLRVASEMSFVSLKVLFSNYQILYFACITFFLYYMLSFWKIDRYFQPYENCFVKNYEID